MLLGRVTVVHFRPGKVARPCRIGLGAPMVGGCVGAV